jgi:N-acetylneuraminate synthase
MQTMRARYDLPVGLSDHTLTNYAAFAAVTLGAAVVEKHFTFSRLMYGSDAPHSLEPEELRDLVRGVRAIEAMLGTAVDKDDLAPYTVMKDTFEKSVVSVVDIPAGIAITEAMIGFKKPGTGIPAARYDEVIGRRARRDIPRDALLGFEDLEEKN